MQRFTPRARLFGALCAAVLTVATAAAVPEQAAADTSSTTVTVFLKAPHPDALAQLAAAQDVPRAQRLAALADLVPTAATRAGVVRALAANGLHVVGQTAWSVTAAGASASAAALFGTRPSAASGSHAARVRAATRALPRVPDALAGVVSAAFPTYTGTPAFHHYATGALAGPDFRNAYTPPTTAPSTGKNDASNTIATLQLANFYGKVPGNFQNSVLAADLAHYATEHHLPDPVANRYYAAVKVDRGPSACDDGLNTAPDLCPGGGDIEVALDQESILSTAPSAHQHAYFAPNTVSGYNDGFSSVYDDVVGNRYATAPDPHITAMSVSWGQCESQTGYSGIRSLEPILQSLTAAGVTVFAAAGDAGIYDCGQGTSSPDVDYPASSPYVIGVGATRLQATKSAANTGANWSEGTWTCIGPLDCNYGNGGSGGGVSGAGYAPGNGNAFGGFAAPGYQLAGVDTPGFAAATKRLVPDISADGAPRSGFQIYSSDIDPAYGIDPTTHHAVIGGTSLSAPISAAGLTNALADAGHHYGAGLIHGALYSAYRFTRALGPKDRHTAFRDVTTGRNGDPNDKLDDPSVYAGPGYDTASGLGAVYWPAVLPYIYSTQQPVVRSVSFTEPTPNTSGWRTIRASWVAVRGSDPRLLGPTHVVVSRLGAAGPVADYYVYPATNSRSFTAQPGSTYQVTVTARDIGQRQSTRVTRTIVVPADDTGFAHGPKWHRVARSNDIAGSHLIAAVKGAYLRASGYGRGYALRVRTGPGAGWLAVALNGRRIKTLNLYSRSYGVKAVPILFSTTRTGRTFTVAALGPKWVGVDGMRVTW